MNKIKKIFSRIKAWFLKNKFYLLLKKLFLSIDKYVSRPFPRLFSVLKKVICFELIRALVSALSFDFVSSVFLSEKSIEKLSETDISNYVSLANILLGSFYSTFIVLTIVILFWLIVKLFAEIYLLICSFLKK